MADYREFTVTDLHACKHSSILYNVCPIHSVLTYHTDLSNILMSVLAMVLVVALSCFFGIVIIPR